MSELAAPLTDPAFYAGDPFPLFARLRAEQPIARHAQGFWALTRHADVAAVSKDPETFCSSRGVLIMDIGRELPELPGALLYIDPPEHPRYRHIVNPGFTSARVRSLEDDIRVLTRALLDRIAAGEVIDVVDAVAVPLPLLVITSLLGVPGDDWPRLREWSDAAIAAGTEMTDETTAALVGFAEYLMAVVAARRTRPRDDLVSMLVASTIGGERLNDGELLMFLNQLLVAGNETTRNLLSGSLVAFAEHPDQLHRLRADPGAIPTAVEELLRWTTPVYSFLRTATRDSEVGGVSIAAGEHLLLLYASANRDEAVFGPTGDRLDVRRAPNPHLAFGAGQHFCLGAALARLEARVFLEEFAARFRAVEVAGPFERLASTVIRGLVHAPLAFSA